MAKKQLLISETLTAGDSFLRWPNGNWEIQVENFYRRGDFLVEIYVTKLEHKRRPTLTKKR